MRYSRLSAAQKRRVDRAIGISMTAVAKSAASGANLVSLGRGYEAVEFPFNTQRRPAVLENGGEDRVLRQFQRRQIINLHRDMLRNSPTAVAQDQQVRVNVVGNVGGKLYASFPQGYEDAANAVMRFFNAEWAPAMEFTFAHNFNWFLKTALTAKESNGNVIFVFDDGILSGGTGSGKVRAFEGDEIGNVSEADFLKHFPKTYKQVQGFVYDELGRFVGCFVSTNQRGSAVFANDATRGYLVLRRDPLDPYSANWIKIGDERRYNQGRAVSPLTAAITTLVDLHEITASETQAAKINAQLVGQILRDANAADDSEANPSPFDDEATDDDLPKTIEFTTKELSSIGGRLDQMPEGLKIELLDTKRPNPNMAAFTELLTGLCGGTRGLARVYATLKAQTSYTAFRGEQVMTQPSFEEMQKDLERDVCDVLASHAIAWAVATGRLVCNLPSGWAHMLSFTWPKMREVNEIDAQNSLAAKLKNGVTTLHRELPPGEYERIFEERKREIDDYKAVGLIYPGTESVSGQLVGQDGQSAAPAPTEKEDKPNE